MRARLGLLLVAAAALLATHRAEAEPVGSYFYLTPHGGYTFFSDKLLASDSSGVMDAVYSGARLGYQWRPWLAIEGAGGFSPTTLDLPGGADYDFWHASGSLVLTPWSGRIGGPFVFGGGGYSKLKPSAGEADLHFGTVEFGGGARVWLTDVVGLVVEARSLLSVPRSGLGESNLDEFIVGAGITLALGAAPRDTDGDGVSDRKDGCPDTPRGCKVDEKGCSLDADGDGVCDGLDQCPSTPKGCKVDAKGCPVDADGDGVCDGLDQCSDTPKGCKVDAKGCSLDADGDGICDGLDQCSDTARGCKVDEKGCPVDPDGDGVCDGLDRCPDTPKGLKVDGKGCPIEVIEKETELLDTGMIRLQNVNFETAKAGLLPGSLPTLDLVGTVLLKWPDLKIEVGGHTDSRGSAVANRKLSEARAKAVLDYLAQKFPALRPEQFTVRGYGKSKPLTPGKDSLSMAQNRRVEFRVLNQDVLKREVERRRLLQQGESPAPPDTTR
jgi:OOP family OmpA-OmpF porin